MKKSLLLFFILAANVAFAQSVGYAGRRLVIKTDVLNGKYLGGRNIEIEYPVIRKLSVLFGFRYHSGMHKQKFTSRDEDFMGGYISDEANVNKARIKALTYKIQLKYYPNSMFSAPKGFFLYGSFEFGKATIEGAATFDYDNASSTSSIKYGNLIDIKVKQYEWGIGFQEIIRELFVIECSGGFSGSRFNASGTPTSQQYTTGVARYYGPNLLPFGKTGPDGTDLSPLGNTSSENKPYKGAYGLSFNFKVGILLF